MLILSYNNSYIFYIFQNLELPTLTLLPLSLMLTGQHYIDTPPVTDIVYMTVGMAYFRKEDSKAKEYLNQVESPEFKGYTAYLTGNYSS